MAIDVRSQQFKLSALLGTTFDLLRSQFSPILKATLLPSGIIAVAIVLCGAGLFFTVPFTGSFDPNILNSLPMVAKGIGIAGITVTAVLCVIACSLISISTMQITADSCGGQAIPCTRSILLRAWGRMSAYWGTLLMMAVAVIILQSPIFLMALFPQSLRSTGSIPTFVLFILILTFGVVIYAGLYAGFSLEAAVLRGQWGVTALRTSFSLVSGRFWKALGYLIVLVLVAYVSMFLPILLIQMVVGFIAIKMQMGNMIMMSFSAVMLVCMMLLQFLFYLFLQIGRTILFLMWERTQPALSPLL